MLPLSSDSLSGYAILHSMGIRKIRGIVKNYAWGNSNFIPSLIGGYTGKPQAELWLGAHCLGDADAEGVPLSCLVYNDKSYLGADWNRFNGRLPFLMKVLAIEKPLSIQCHPNKNQAHEGWNRENEARLKGDTVSYMDDNEKSEMILAITPITALCGFRTLEKIMSDLAFMIPKSYQKYLENLYSDIKSLFFLLFFLREEEKIEILDELYNALSSNDSQYWEGSFLTRKGITLLALNEHGYDIGCIFPYLMNVVHLDKDEVMAIKPGTLHAYIYGNGVEVMNNSDNVLRCALTKKRVDIQELIHITNFSSLDVKKRTATIDPFGRLLFSSPSPDFQLLVAKYGYYHIKDAHCGILLVTNGYTILEQKDKSITVNAGETVIIPSKEEYWMRVYGEASIAEIPLSY